MYSKVVDNIHRKGTWYFSATKSVSCKLETMHFSKLPPKDQVKLHESLALCTLPSHVKQVVALKDNSAVQSNTMQSSADQRVETVHTSGKTVMHSTDGRPVLAQSVNALKEFVKHVSN